MRVSFFHFQQQSLKGWKVKLFITASWQRTNDLAIQNSSENSDKTLGPHFSPWFTVRHIQQRSAGKSSWWGICFKLGLILQNVFFSFNVFSPGKREALEQLPAKPWRGPSAQGWCCWGGQGDIGSFTPNCCLFPEPWPFMQRLRTQSNKQTLNYQRN